ncbi:hypothetical protein CC78DRAFT_604659, partial [Lojkania enalia]
FLPSSIAPFESLEVGTVTPALRARYDHHPFSFKGFWNFIRMAHLVRRAHEFVAAKHGWLWAILSMQPLCYLSVLSLYGSRLPTLPLERVNMLGPCRAAQCQQRQVSYAVAGKSQMDVKIQICPDRIIETELGE